MRRNLLQWALQGTFAVVLASLLAAPVWAQDSNSATADARAAAESTTDSELAESLRVIRLKEIDVETLPNLLRTVIPGKLNFAVDERTNSLVLRGAEEQVAAIAELLRELDSSEPTATASDSGEQIQLVKVHRSPDELVTVLSPIFSECTIIADPQSRSLLFHGSKEDLKLIGALLQRLDAAPKVVQLTMLVAELSGDSTRHEFSEVFETAEQQLRQLVDAGDARLTREVHCSAVEDQVTQMQLGEIISVASGEIFAGRGQRSITMRQEPVGTMVSFTARCENQSSESESSRILVEFSLEQSHIEQANAEDNSETNDDQNDPGQDARSERPIHPPGKKTLTIQSTVAIPNRKCVVLRDGPGARSDEAMKMTVVILSASAE